MLRTLNRFVFTSMAIVMNIAIVSANTDTNETTDAGEQNTSAIDQASIVPKNEEDRAEGIIVWNKLNEVLSHPRCVNCHVSDDRPRWSGEHYGKTREHGMNVQASTTRVGLPGQQMCITCHTQTNSDVLHGPPGAEVWALAPKEMAWWGKTSAELCAIVKDPTKTGNRDIAAFADHIGHDPLVAWGWNPGLGREPAPYSATETVAMFGQWLALGLPCPE